MSKSLLKSASATRKGVAAVTAPLPTSKRITVPFSSLFLSKSNVRSAKDHSEEGIKRLAAMIEAGGLLSDLHVSRELKNGLPTGRFGVEAGGRRWRALGLLVSAKKMHSDEPINCKEVEEGSETSVSLAENLGQERCTRPTNLPRSRHCTRRRSLWTTLRIASACRSCMSSGACGLLLSRLRSSRCSAKARPRWIR